MYNKTTLIGRMIRQPELRYTPQGTPVANFTLAVNRKFNKEETDWVDIVIWKQQAEYAANYGDKGRLVLVDGRLQTRTYENRDGQKVKVVEVVADSITFLDGKKRDGQAESRDSSGWDDLGQVRLEDIEMGGDGEIPF